MEKEDKRVYISQGIGWTMIFVIIIAILIVWFEDVTLIINSLITGIICVWIIIVISLSATIGGKSNAKKKN